VVNNYRRRRIYLRTNGTYSEREGRDTMSEATSHGHAPPFNAAPLRTGLGARIGWICQALRLAAVIWVVWELVFVVIHWSDKAAVLTSYERVFSTVLVVSTARYAVAFGVVMVSLAVIFVIAF